MTKNNNYDEYDDWMERKRLLEEDFYPDWVQMNLDDLKEQFIDDNKDSFNDFCRQVYSDHQNEI